MGSLFEPDVPEITEPERQEMLDFVDYTSGVEQKTITRADGTRQIVRQELPKTAEEQALQDEIDATIESSFGRIKEMSQYASAMDIPEFQNVIQAYENVLTGNIDDSFRIAGDASEEALARRGLSDSSSAVQQRRELQQGRVDAERNARDQLVIQAENLRNTEIGRQQNLLGLATGQNQQAFNNQLQTSQFGAGLQSGQLNADLSHMSLLQSQRQQNAANQMQASAMGAQTFGDLLGAAAGGYGSFLGAKAGKG